MTQHGIARRALLASAGALFAWSFAPRDAFAAGRDPRLLVVVLRGGLDGLAAVPPIGDRSYEALRGEFGLSQSETTQRLDDLFSLNANLPTLGELYGRGHALIVHAVATPYRGRSHFDGQDMLENGFPEGAREAGSGWLNRALEVIPRSERITSAPSKGLAISPTVPLIMRGRAPIDTWQPQILKMADDATISRLLDLYEARDPTLAQALRDGAELDRLLGTGTGVRGAPGRPDYRSQAFAAAQMMARPDGPRLAAMSLHGWDTHSQQGPVKGQLGKQLLSLDDALASLRDGLAPVWSDTAVVLITEFGRTARINGTLGTDHGTATVAMLLGGAVRGGRVISDWPGLAENKLYQGRDLAPTLDIRAILKGVLHDFFGVDDKVLNAHVFPGSDMIKRMSGLIG